MVYLSMKLSKFNVKKCALLSILCVGLLYYPRDHNEMLYFFFKPDFCHNLHR